MKVDLWSNLLSGLALNRSFNADGADDEKTGARGLVRGASMDDPSLPTTDNDMMTGHNDKTASLE